VNRRCAQRQARLELTWAVVGLVLIQLLVASCIVARLPQVLDPEFNAKLVRLKTRIAETPARPLALVVGSSRVHMGLDAGRLSAAGAPWLIFNLGMGGAGPIMHGVSLHRVRAAGIHPDLVIVEVVPAQFLACKGCPIEEQWLNGARLRVDELALIHPYLGKPWRPVLYRWLPGQLFPCTHYQRALRRWVQLDRTPQGGPIQELPADGDDDPYGWRPGPDALSTEQAAAASVRTASEYRKYFSDASFSVGTIRALRDIIGTCRRDSIPVLLLLMPESKGFRALYPDGFECNLNRLLDELCRAEHLPIINARTWVEDNGFLDLHHLCRNGAQVFTNRFQEVLEKSWLADQMSSPIGELESVGE
jgi:hypothetical protein